MVKPYCELVLEAGFAPCLPQFVRFKFVTFYSKMSHIVLETLRSLALKALQNMAYFISHTDVGSR